MRIYMELIIQSDQVEMSVWKGVEGSTWFYANRWGESREVKKKRKTILGFLTTKRKSWSGLGSSIV
jgi:hypothetical protein